jgi:hypothetical protein
MNPLQVTGFHKSHTFTLTQYTDQKRIVIEIWNQNGKLIQRGETIGVTLTDAMHKAEEMIEITKRS